jgi:hypothetical protein
MNKNIKDDVDVKIEEDVNVVVLINSLEAGRGKDKTSRPGLNSIKLKSEGLNDPELIEITERMKLILQELTEEIQ